MVDKFDPILGIWNYIDFFQGKIDIDQFLDAMNDFFLYPETQNACIDKKNIIDRTLFTNARACQELLFKEKGLFQNTLGGGNSRSSATLN